MSYFVIFGRPLISAIFFIGVCIILIISAEFIIAKIKGSPPPTKESVVKAIQICDAFIQDSELEIQKLEVTMPLSAKQSTLMNKALSDTPQTAELYDRSISIDLFLISFQLEQIAFWQECRDSLQIELNKFTAKE